MLNKTFGLPYGQAEEECSMLPVRVGLPKLHLKIFLDLRPVLLSLAQHLDTWCWFHCLFFLNLPFYFFSLHKEPLKHILLLIALTFIHSIYLSKNLHTQVLSRLELETVLRLGFYTNTFQLLVINWHQKLLNYSKIKMKCTYEISL